MITDVVENELGSYTHQDVENLKENKLGEWESVRGYLEAAEYGMDSALEINDDWSGDRFIIFTKDGALRRLDYDITNSPHTGYEMESYVTIALPSGITWDGTTRIRFFYHNGVVRITGYSEPLWYGYIYRKLFYTGLQDKEVFTFEDAGDVNYFTSIYCNKSQFAAAKYGTYCMSIQSIGNPFDTKGYVYRTFTAYTAGYYKLRCWVKKPTSINGNDYIIKVGTTAGGEDLARWRQSVVNTATWQLVDIEFEVPDDKENSIQSVYISIYPESGTGNGDTLYVDQWILEESYPQLTLNNWFIQKAELAKQTIEITDINQCGEVGDDTLNHYLKIALIYDDSQYTIMHNPDIIFPNFSSGAQNFAMASAKDGAQVKLQINGENLITDIGNKRFSGVLICWATDEISPDQAGMVWSVVNRIDFNEKKRIVSYSKDVLWYDNAFPKRLYTRYDSKGVNYHAQWQDGYFRVGARVSLNNIFISKITSVVIGSGNTDYIEFEDDLYPAFVDETYSYHGFTGPEDQAVNNVIIQINQIYDYDEDEGLSTSLGIDINGGTEFSEYTEIPSGTIDNIKKYSHHQVINDRAYALSIEEDEGDVIYYSPVYQYDSFPDTQIVQTPTGDLDNNRALIERDGRFVALKRKSVSQGQFTGGTYYHDKDGVRHGLYATEGYIVIDDILYFMDNDDVYMFNGVNVAPFLENSKVRKLYATYVKETSFFAYNPLDKELWMCLDTGIILVFDFERRRFYKRGMLIDPDLAFLGYDNKLYLNDSSIQLLVMINHNETEYDELVSCSFRTGLVDLKTPEHFKKANKVYARVSAPNVTLTLNLKDDNESGQYLDSAAINSSVVFPTMFKPNYLFKEMYLDVSFTPVITGSIKIKSFDIIVGRWR